MSRLWVWGCGELGTRVGKKWIRDGGICTGITQTTGRHNELLKLGFSVALDGPSEFDADDHLLICVPGTQRLQSVIDGLAGKQTPKRAVVTSSTGYYHGVSGPIDDHTPAGDTPRAQEIAKMENSFSEWTGHCGVVIRLGGLYRPGRGPLNAFKKRGSAPAGAGDKTLALIHYDDAAQASYAALKHNGPQTAYIGVTPPCPTRRDFYMAASVMLDVNLPSFGRNSGQAPAQYQVDSLRRDLLPEPEYPRWQAALVP